MKLRILMAATAATLLASPFPSDASNLDFLHTKALIAGHTCMKDHFHHGKGSGPDQVTAMTKAMNDWIDFTSLEYGAEWGNLSIAVAKKATCGQLRDAWMCEVTAKPCRM